MLVNFLVTTSLFSSFFEEYILKSSYVVWNEGQLVNFNVVTYGNEIKGPQNAFASSSLSISCSSSSLLFDSNEVQSILRDYHKMKDKDNYLRWNVKQSNMSCVIFDLKKQLLWLIGDNAGTIPLWFAFQSSSSQSSQSQSPQSQSSNNGNMIITTDLLGAIVLNYTDLTAVGAGLTLAFDMNTFEILSMNHWSQYSINNNKFFNEPKLSESFSWSISLLNSSQQLLSSYVSLSIVLTELDMLDASSILLDCAISTHPQMKDEFRVRYHSAPLVTDVENNPEIINSYIYCKFIFILLIILLIYFY